MSDDREVRWATIGDGGIGAVVSGLGGETFGVVAYSMTEDEWLRVAGALAGFTAAEHQSLIDPSDADRGLLDQLDELSRCVAITVREPAQLPDDFGPLTFGFGGARRGEVEDGFAAELTRDGSTTYVLGYGVTLAEFDRVVGSP